MKNKTGLIIFGISAVVLALIWKPMINMLNEVEEEVMSRKREGEEDPVTPNLEILELVSELKALNKLGLPYKQMDEILKEASTYEDPRYIVQYLREKIDECRKQVGNKPHLEVLKGMGDKNGHTEGKDSSGRESEI